MRAIILLCSFLIAIEGSSQTISTTYYGESVGSDIQIKFTLPHADGGFLTCGTSNLSDTGGYRSWVNRYDSTGSLVWQHTYSASAALWLDNVPGGGFVVGGEQERAPFDDVDGYVMRLDNEGNTLWTRKIEKGLRSKANCVRAMQNGHIAACGHVTNYYQGKNRVDAFLTVLDQQGNILWHTEKTASSDAPSHEIMVGNDNEITWAWGRLGDETISRYSANGQLKWEKNWTFNTLYQPLWTNQNGFWCETAQGEIAVFTQGDKILYLDKQSGSINREVQVDNKRVDGMGFYSNASEYTFYYVAQHYDSLAEPALFQRLMAVTFNNSGNIIRKDSLYLGAFGSYKISVAGENRLLLTHEHVKGVISEVKKTNGLFSVVQQWNFDSTLPESKEYYESECQTNDGDFFILGRRINRIENTIKFILLKTDAAGNQLRLEEIGQGSRAITKIFPTAAGGVIFSNIEDTTWCIDQTGKLLWKKSMPHGLLFADSNNGFSIVSDERTQQNPDAAIYIFRKYDQDGEILVEHPVFEDTIEYRNITSGFITFENTFILIGNNLIPGQNQVGKMIFALDEDGHLKAQHFIDEKFSFYGNQSASFLRSKTGDLLFSEGTGQVVVTTCIRDGEVVWQSRLQGIGNEAFRSIKISDAPCGGYVVSALSKAKGWNNFWLRSPLIHDITLLQHIKEDGSSGPIFSYRPYPEPYTLDTAFIPGYIHREWGNRLNNQTLDLYFRTISFPTPELPGKENKLEIRPNPSGAETCLHYNSLRKGQILVVVSDISGKTIDRFWSEKTEETWSLHYGQQLPTGTYVITIQLSGEKPVSSRWIKAQ